MAARSFGNRADEPGGPPGFSGTPARIRRNTYWLYYLPNPFTAQDRRAGYTYQLSVLQLEVARTEVFDRPLHGRQFFEEVIRQHLDLGRPEQIQLFFDARPSRPRRRYPARTRVFTQDVNPSLQVSHRSTRVKQYWKLYADRLVMPSRASLEAERHSNAA